MSIRDYAADRRQSLARVNGFEGAKQRPPSSCRMPLEKIFNTDRGRPAGHRLRAKQPPDEATGAAKLKHVVDAKKPAGA